MDLLVHFRNNWIQKAFASKEQKILLAVSGGADSMVMAQLFLQSKISFGIAHCNFQLREGDAIKDEIFVTEWAAQNEIPFFITKFDTKNIAEKWKTGIQETARKLRYDWLQEIRQAHNYAFVATAHHANDNAETLLMNLFKGTGISGLHGIREKNNHIIRPLLFASKSEIVAYANDNNISFREDVSNASDKYLRNAVRLHILPAIEPYFPNVVARINESISHFSQTEILYQREVQTQIKKLIEKRGSDIYIPVLKLKKLEALETLCYELFASYGFSSSQTPHIIRLIEAESGRYIDSSSHKVIKDRNFLIITAQAAMATDFISIENAPFIVDTAQAQFHFSICKKPSVIIESSLLAYVDADKIKFPVILRRRRTGDYFYPLGMDMKKKKLSRFFIDQKIPLHKKEQAWVIETDKKIVWIAGMRIDERFKIKPSTKNVLKIEMREI